METDDTDKGQRSIQSIEVGGRLLLALAEQAAPMTLKDLAARANLPPSRAHPYLVSFGKLELIEQDPVSGRYALGPASLQVGLACLRQSDPLKAAGPVAEALARRIDQTVAIAVWANFGPTIVRIVEASQPLHVNMRVGTVMSIFGTATGRAFAAVLPRQKLELVPGVGVLSETARLDGKPVGDLDAALAEVRAEVAAHGVTRALGRPIPGVNAFSAAAFDHEGAPRLVITSLGHEGWFSAEWDSPIAKEVQEAAAEVSRRLGYRREA